MWPARRTRSRRSSHVVRDMAPIPGIIIPGARRKGGLIANINPLNGLQQRALQLRGGRIREAGTNILPVHLHMAACDELRCTAGERACSCIGLIPVSLHPRNARAFGARAQNTLAFDVHANHLDCLSRWCVSVISQSSLGEHSGHGSSHALDWLSRKTAALHLHNPPLFALGRSQAQ